MTPRTVPVRGCVLLAAVLLSLAGCARAEPAESAPGQPTPSSAASSTASGSGSSTAPTPSRSQPSPSQGPPDATLPAGPVLTLDGTARRGVEPGCTILDTTDHRTYLLLGAGGRTPDQKSIPLGVPLRVRGVEVDQLLSYCQQGSPVEVVDVTRR